MIVRDPLRIAWTAAVRARCDVCAHVFSVKVSARLCLFARRWGLSWSPEGSGPRPCTNALMGPGVAVLVSIATP